MVAGHLGLYTVTDSLVMLRPATAHADLRNGSWRLPGLVINSALDTTTAV